MKLTVHLREDSAGAVEVSHDGGTTWRASSLSPEMKLAGKSFEDLQSFLFSLLDATDLTDFEANLRLTTQRAIGCQLYRELFGGLTVPPDFQRWLHIVPVLAPGADAAARDANERFASFVSRVPWTLLTLEDNDSAPFLALNGVEPVAITIDGAPGRADRPWARHPKMPPYPRILLVVPRVEDGTPTEGEAHEAELRAVLDPYLDAQAEGALKVVRSFAEFQSAIADKQLEPHIVYFYGHGFSKGTGTSFQFEADGGKADWRSFDEVRATLQPLVDRTHFAPLVWVNACLGAAAESDSALASLAPIACCVITTRTLAAVSDARALGLAALPMIVVGGHAPPAAIRDFLQARPRASARWASTIIAVQYEAWTALGTDDRSAVDFDSAGDFPIRLDRVAPLQRVSKHISGRLAAAPASLPIVWHGAPDQGLDAFEILLEERIRTDFPTWSVRTRHVDLQPDCAPMKPRDRVQHFIASLIRGLAPSGAGTGAAATRADSVRLKNLLASLGGTRSLLLLSHGPFGEGHAGLVRDYARFWRDYFSMVVPSGMFVVLGFGFEESSPGSYAGVEESLAEALGPVPPRELANHLAAYHMLYQIPKDNAAAEAQALFEAHRGSFNGIRSELEIIAGIRPSDSSQGENP